MAAIYTRYPLSKPRTIRVLDLSPSRSPDDPLKGSLRVISLDSPFDSYNALSYTWGNSHPSPSLATSSPSPTSGPSRQILLADKGLLSVTENCYQGLLHVRSRWCTMPIWVDAICINQADNSERNVQVALMKETFERAGTTFVWLGAGNERSDYAMQWIADATWELSALRGVRFTILPYSLGATYVRNLVSRGPDLFRQSERPFLLLRGH
jgi:Heterokaryon incompatibility protein (HET)